jgi:hypothetical protein
LKNANIWGTPESMADLDSCLDNTRLCVCKGNVNAVTSAPHTHPSTRNKATTEKHDAKVYEAVAGIQRLKSRGNDTQHLCCTYFW